MALSAMQNRALQGYVIHVVEADTEFQFSDGPPGERSTSEDFLSLSEGIQHFLKAEPRTRFEWHLLPPKSKRFKVVLWEQRRIEMLVEAHDRDHAEFEAEAIWDAMPDGSLHVHEIVEIDNHDIKSIIVDDL